MPRHWQLTDTTRHALVVTDIPDMTPSTPSQPVKPEHQPAATTYRHHRPGSRINSTVNVPLPHTASTPQPHHAHPSPTLSLTHPLPPTLTPPLTCSARRRTSTTSTRSSARSCAATTCSASSSRSSYPAIQLYSAIHYPAIQRYTLHNLRTHATALR